MFSLSFAGCPSSNPDFLGTCFATTLPSTVTATIDELFPETKHPDPSVINPNVFVYFGDGSAPNNMTITFLQSTSGGTNRLGYATYSEFSETVSNPVYAIQRTDPLWGAHCLKTGDSWQFGPFYAGQTLVFFLDRGMDAGARFWSYFAPGLVNSQDDIYACGYPGCIHSAVAYLVDYDLTIFGWEDGSLGDADYNDLVFYVSLQGQGFYNEVPSYQNGTILICNNATIVSWNSFTDVACQSWGLLETSTGYSSCLTYLAIPTGWTWAPNDAASRGIILSSYKQWAYTGSNTCFQLQASPTTAVGYTVDASGNLQPCTSAIKYLTSKGAAIAASAVNASTSLCYNMECSARFVLKSLTQSVACASVTRCGPTVVNTALLSAPQTFSSVDITIPDSVTTYLTTGSGSYSTAVQLQLTDTDLTNPKIDVVVLTDFYATTATQKSTIASSWASVTSQFDSIKLNAQFAAFAFVPSSDTSSASYSLSSDYSFARNPSNFPSSAYHSVGCGSGAAAQLQRGRNLVAAVNRIATSASLNWRTGAYRVVWIHSLCSLPGDAAAASSGSPSLRSIQQTTGLVPIIANGGVGTSSFTFSSNVPWTYGFYFSGSSVSWDNPFRGYAYSPFRGANLMAPLVKTLQAVASQGDVQWLSNIPSSAVALSDSGYASFPFTVAWPSSVPATTANLYYSATMQIIGRDTASYLIYFNHPPSLESYSTSIPVSQTGVTFTMTTSDPDSGNQLNLIVKKGPTQGTLTVAPTTTVPKPPALVTGTALPVNSFSLSYTPTNRNSAYIETITLSVSDGCMTADANVTISVTKVNRAPVATAFTVSVNEDQLMTASFNLSKYISDPDGDAVQAYLPSAAYVASGTVRLGTFTPSTLTTAYALQKLFNSSDAVYRLNVQNGLTGYGSISIPFRAYDGALYSSTAILTIKVVHINHAPTIEAISLVKSKVGSSANFAVSTTDLDSSYPGETATIQIIASSWAQVGTANAYSVDAFFGVTTLNYAGATATASAPLNFSRVSPYTSASNVTASGSVLKFTGYQWTAPKVGGQTPAIQTITIRAIDTAGLTSDSIVISFALADGNPPTWVQYPGQFSTSQYQGFQWDRLYFSAFDLDGPDQMSQFKFTVITAPLHGAAYLESASGAISPPLVAGFTFTPTTAGLTSMVKYNSSGIVTDFLVQYKSNIGWYGTETISFAVTDTTNLTASEYAFATFTTIRSPTPPVSSNISIFGFEEQLTAFAIPAFSTNDITLPVTIIVESISLYGDFLTSNATTNATWGVGTSSISAATNGGSVPGFLRGVLGFFSNPSTAAAGTFTYRAYEAANNLYSELYTAQVFIQHVNHAPTSATQSTRIAKRQLLSLRLPASDPDADDTDATLSAAIISMTPFNGGPPLYYDQNLTEAVTSASISAGQRLSNRTLYYVCSDRYDTSVPMMTYQFRVYDQHNASSPPYFGYIYVNPAGDSPKSAYNRTVTPQETPVPMNLASDAITESTQTPTTSIISLPDFGTFSYCTDAGACFALTETTTLPFVLPSTSGRVVFVPRPYDWGTDFTSFTYSMTDPGTSASGNYTMIIDVTHVNKPPTVYPANFLTTAQTTAGTVINESSWRTFDWYSNDVDSMPSTLKTSVRITFYTSQGFSLYSCDFAEGSWNQSACTFDSTTAPAAVRSDFAKNAKIQFTSYQVESADCLDDQSLKLRYGSTSRQCEARFRFAFVPTPFAYYTPYVTITWTTTDPSGAESDPISALIFVKAVNNPPTIWAPTQVVAAGGIANPFIRDTTVTSSTYNNPVTVADVDSLGKVEQMTFELLSGSGNWTFPTTASCTSTGGSNWVCLDKIASFNQWLGDVRFNVSAGDRALLRFTIDDLGNSGDYKPSPHLSASANTTVIISAAVAVPKGNSSTLAIAVGVAAGAGLLLLGALGFFLRNAVAPPDEDYFSAATAPISAAPQSPLYQAQNTEHMSPLYRGNS